LRCVQSGGGVGGGGAFDIDDESGVITVSRPLDRERRASWELTVTAVNAGVTRPDMSAAVVPVTVQVDDVNDNSPTVRFPTSADQLLVQLSRRAAPGTLVTRIDAYDPDAGQQPRVESEDRFWTGSRNMAAAYFHFRSRTDPLTLLSRRF